MTQRATVRFNIYLTKDAFEALERLQKLTGKQSMADTIRSAIRVYEAVQQSLNEGKSLEFVDRSTGERERMVLV